MARPPEIRTVKNLRVEIDRMGKWIDRLYEKYGEQPPKRVIDTAYKKLVSALRALNELE